MNTGGEFSTISFTLTVISCVEKFELESVAVTVALKTDLVSKSGAVTNDRTPSAEI